MILNYLFVFDKIPGSKIQFTEKNELLNPRNRKDKENHHFCLLRF